MLPYLSLVDALIVVVLSLGILIGVLQGVVRQILLLGAVYFGMVLAAQYYIAAATGLALIIPGSEPRAYSTVGLILVFVVAVLAINAIGYLTYASTRLPVLAILDRFGGALLGVTSAWLFVTLMLTATDFGLSGTMGSIPPESLDLIPLLQQSSLVQLAHIQMPTLYDSLRPWLPAGLPVPFAA